jgi:hypothetical protein
MERKSPLYRFNPLRFSLPPQKISEEERRKLIAEAAFYLAERRNFEPGHELEDWVEAEAEVNERLTKAGLR